MPSPILDKELLDASIDVAASTTGTIVGAPGANKRIVVVNYLLISSKAGTAQWKSAATVKSGALSTGDNGGASFSGQIAGPAFSCGTNEALTLTTGAQVGGTQGHLTYYIEYVG